MKDSIFPLTLTLLFSSLPVLAVETPTIQWKCSKSVPISNTTLVPCVATAFGPDKSTPIYNVTFSCTLGGKKTVACLSGPRGCAVGSPIVLNPGCSTWHHHGQSNWPLPKFTATLAAPFQRPTRTFRVSDIGRFTRFERPTAVLPPPGIQPRPRSPNADTAILFENRTPHAGLERRQDSCEQYCEFNAFPKKRDVNAIPVELLSYSRFYVPRGSVGEIKRLVAEGLRVDGTVDWEEKRAILEAVLNNSEEVGDWGLL